MPARKFFDKVWLPEILGIVASAVCLIVLAAILAAYDGEPIFDWHHITLNAVVSTLSTACEAALLFAVEELISQWKWIVFASGRRRLLIDFERIDAASRGPLGSLKIIRQKFLSVGALVVLISLAIDPFTQQLVQYTQTVVYTQDDRGYTWMARANRYSEGDEYGVAVSTVGSTRENRTNVVARASFSMQSAILSGLINGSISGEGTYACSTGNCTWPDSETLAVCARCSDVTPTLERIVTDGGLYSYLESDNGAAAITKDGGTAFRLENGLYIDNTNGWVYGNTTQTADVQGAVLMTAFGTVNASETVTMQDLDTLIWSTSMIRVDPPSGNKSTAWPDLPLSAWECAIFYCIKKYSTVVHNGMYVARQTMNDATRTSDSWQPEGHNADVLPPSVRESTAFDNYFSVVSRTDLTLLSIPSGQRFNISQNAVDGISEYFQTTFASTLRTYNITDDGEKTGRLNGFYLNSSVNVQYSPDIMAPMFASYEVRDPFLSLEISMTDQMRFRSDPYMDGVENRVGGKIGQLVTFYHVVWPWITLHCLLVIAGIVFLLVTLWKNQEGGKRGRMSAPVWKSSSLATMSRGSMIHGILLDLKTVKHMEHKAKTSEVSLLTTEDLASSSLDHLDFDPFEVEEQAHSQGMRLQNLDRLTESEGGEGEEDIETQHRTD